MEGGKREMQMKARKKVKRILLLEAVMLASLVTIVQVVSAEAPENEAFQLTLISIFKKGE